MPMVFSHLLGRQVDDASEEHRHECECRWLLEAKSTRTEKHLYLYGVTDREQLFETSAKTGERQLREDHKKLWPKDGRGRTINPLMHFRGLEHTDKILADAKTLYELRQK